MNRVFQRARGVCCVLVAAGTLLASTALAQPGGGLLGSGVTKAPGTEAEHKAKIAKLEKQVKADPGNYRLHYQLGNAYYDAGFAEKARDAYGEALRLNPKYIEALVNLGIALGDLSESTEAILTFEKALAINPEDCNARSNLGNAYYAMSRYSEAMYEYRRAIAIDPKCHSALYNIGVAFADAGLFREAVSWWRKVVQVAPGTDAARNADDNIKILERFIQAPIPPAKRESPKK